jgi:hypothetical protein
MSSSDSDSEKKDGVAEATATPDTIVHEKAAAIA